MAITYNRGKDPVKLTDSQLVIGKFYRDHDDTRKDFRVYLVTDEDCLVTLAGVQYSRNRGNDGYVEVEVDINVGGDL